MICLDRRLAYAKTSNYRTTVSIISSTLSVVVPVFINILPAENEPPRFNDHKKSLFIREGLPVGAFIGQVTVNYGSQKRYELMGAEEKVSVDSITGLLTSNMTFDREKQSLYQFTVIAKDGYGNKASQHVDLYVDDVNDNTPKFYQKKYSIHLSEDTKTGTKILKMNFEDADLDNDFRFAVATSGNEYCIFDVDQNGYLLLAKPLDREAQNIHRITLILEDHVAPNPVHRVETTVEITVLDVNDNAPEFSKNLVFTVFTNAREDTVVGTVTAEDPDLGINGLVNFRLLPETHPEQTFNVDPLFGYIQIIKTPTQAQYHFTVEAFDNGTPRLRSQANVTIITVDYVSESYSNHTTGEVRVTVTEDAAVGHFVTQILGREGDIFRIQGGNELGHFRIHPESGCVFVSQGLNFEAVKEYNLKISDKVTIRITVTDVNDEYPVFIDGEPVRFTVAENIAGPYPIVLGSTIAEDSDTGLNGEVAYSILQGDTDLFGINSRSGLLYLNKGLDREDQTEYEITVQATDLGTPRLSSTAEVVVTVVDVNDNAPVFEQPYYVADISENLPPGQEVVQVRAKDKDAGVNAKIRYTLLNEAAIPFAINHTTGLLTTTESLDRERKSSYNLQITATDNGVVYQHSTVTNLTVHVLDVNDNSPVILNKQFDVFVPVSLRRGEFVYAIDAVDNDADQNLCYTLTGGSERPLFNIDQDGGIWTSNFFTSKLVYSILVTVSDSGDRNTTVSLSFYTAEDKLFPRFKSFKTNYSIPEDAKDQLLLQTQTESARVVYSIAAGDPFEDFEIDPLSGTIIVRKVDRETKAFYRLFIGASYPDSTTHMSYKEVTVAVEDLNDNRPKFEKVLYKTKIFENEMSPYKLVKVKATDKDIGENAKISYRIMDGNFGSRFFIDENGQITVSESLDREEQASYRLTIEAYNPNSPTQNQIAIVEVTVEDENDNSPKFTRLFHAEVAEDSAVGTFVVQVTSTDPDGSENSLNRYTLEGEDSDVFNIDPDSGNVTLAKPVDRETKDEYRVRVKASDGFWQVATTLTITVTDINDNAPKFVKKINEFSVHRDTPTGSPVHQVSALDIDSGFNSQVQYQFLEDSRSFRIDPKTGLIYSTLPLKNNPEIMTLKVVAEDMGIPSLSATVTLRIFVVGDNVHVPEFTENDYKFPINARIPKGTVIGQVQATDADVKRPGMVRYALTSSKGDFRINETTGEITYLSGPLTNQDLSVKAYDLGAPPKVATVTVKIVAVDKATKEPEFVKKIYNFYAGETMKVEAKSDDELWYSLKSSTVPFTIDSRSGIITPKTVLSGNHSFTVITESLGWPKFTSKALVRVYSNAKNAPIRNIKLKLSEATRIGNVVTKVEGSGSYSVQPGPFTVDTVTGEIRLVQALERKVYSIYVTGPEVTLLEVIVIKAQKLQPKFLSCPSDTVYLSKKSYNSTVIAQPNADTIDGFPLQYSALSELATIDSESGLLKLRSLKDAFNVTVMVSSGRLRSTVPDHCTLKFETVNLAPTPIFNKTNYHASIPENAVNGTIVLDLDMAVPQDARLEILSGNKDKCFCLDPSGKLTVCGLLDREMNDNYSMEIAVTVKEDIRSLTVVQVTVEDVNDNPPYLEEGNSIAYVLENTKPGTKILSLKPKDMDLPLNQGHFSYNIQSDFFAITEEGVISTKISFDREKRSLHLVPIQISDYGSPRKTASIVVKVVIDDQDDNLPSPGPVKIHIATSLDTYAGVILKAGPRDVDTIDYSLCRLAQPSNQFNYSSACSLDMSKVKTSSSYELKAKTHRNLEFPISVHFYRIQEYHKMEAVTVTLDAVDQTMADLVASLQEALPDMRVVLTGATVTPTYRNRLFLAFIDRNDNVVSGLESVEIVKNHLKKKSTIREATVDYRSCSKNCLNLGKCERSQEEKDTVELRGFASAWIVPQIHVVERCVCPKLVKGEFCEQSQPSCAEKSSGGCRNQGICDTSKAVCICPKGFKGVYCEKDVDECAQKGTCPSTSVCQNLLGSYQCICKPGYSGKNCETKAKTCEPINTICHRGSCNEDKCVCEPGWTGKSCDQKLLSFGAGSYIEMSKLDQLTSISFQITMRHAVGLIFYSFDPRDSTRFMAVDVAGGRLRFSQNLTRNGYSNTILDAPLDSGNWNKVSLVHSGTPYSSGTISLSVDTCDPETSICKRCQTAACKTTIYLSQEAFIVPDNGLIFGGARDLSDVSRLSQKVTSDYFEGCLRNLRINEKPLDAFANSQVGLLDFCPLVEKPDYCRNKDSCSGGVCTSEWNGSKCLCDGFEANNCVLAMEPVTFEDAGIRYALSKNMKQKVAFTPSDILVSGEDCKEDERREEAEGSQEGEFDDENVSTQAVEIDFKTPMQNAVIFTVLYRPKTATLQIRNGTLRYAIHYNERLLFEITNDFVFVSDNKWHRALVDVSRNGQTVRLTLDGHNTTSHSGFAYPQIISASIDSLTLGGGFSGCMRRFVVFDQAQPLINRLDARLPLQYLDQIGRTGGPVRTGCDEAKSDVEFFQGGYTYAFGGFLLLLLIVLILVIVAYLKFTKPPVQKPKRITTDCVRTIDSLFQNSGICNYNDAFDILSTTTTHRADSLPHIYETPPEAPVSKRHSKVPKMGTSPMNTVLPHRNSARQLKQAVRESAASARNASIPATTSESESESFGTRSRSRSRRSKRRPMTSASTATNSTLTTSLPSASSAIPIGQAYVRESDGYDAVSNSSSDYMRPRSLPVPQEHCRVQYL
ncbi:hypothetical protein L596_030345 [Steinernema carpocapsae]|uniref:Uncharacterized protein n=1 Tax=Steinernema carpocapsae TaxID=34508 RepID=A0A4U5LP64_STECR|nr:hypothetical protein L596_030345 [Steinernema carpocapsae]